MKEITSPRVKSNAAMYSHAIEHGGVLYIAGQVPRDQETGAFVTGDFEAEVRMAMENLKAVLEAGGSNLASVIRATVYLTDSSLFEVFNRVYLEYFTQRPLPARTTVVVQLVRPEVRFEIDAIAVVASAGMHPGG